MQESVGIRSLAVSLMGHTPSASPWPGDAVKVHGHSVPQALPSSLADVWDVPVPAIEALTGHCLTGLFLKESFLRFFHNVKFSFL